MSFAELLNNFGFDEGFLAVVIVVGLTGLWLDR